jgi:hypothetical protein
MTFKSILGKAVALVLFAGALHLNSIHSYADVEVIDADPADTLPESPDRVIGAL